jgi:hypothetical protein
MEISADQLSLLPAISELLTPLFVAAEESRKFAEEHRKFQDRVISELALLKQGIIIIGGKAVSDMYGVTVETKEEIESAATALMSEMSPEELAEFPEKCHKDVEFRKENTIQPLGEFVKAVKPEAKKPEILARGNWVAGMYYKITGHRPCFQICKEVGKRKQSSSFYPKQSERLVSTLVYYFFQQRVDSEFKLSERMY